MKRPRRQTEIEHRGARCDRWWSASRPEESRAVYRGEVGETYMPRRLLGEIPDVRHGAAGGVVMSIRSSYTTPAGAVRPGGRVRPGRSRTAPSPERRR